MNNNDNREVTLLVVKTRSRVLLIIIGTEALLAAVGVCAMAGTIYLKTHTEPEVLAGLIAITSGLIGSMTTLLTTYIQASRQVIGGSDMGLIPQHEGDKK